MISQNFIIVSIHILNKLLICFLFHLCLITGMLLQKMITTFTGKIIHFINYICLSAIILNLQGDSDGTIYM